MFRWLTSLIKWFQFWSAFQPRFYFRNCSSLLQIMSNLLHHISYNWRQICAYMKHEPSNYSFLLFVKNHFSTHKGILQQHAFLMCVSVLLCRSTIDLECSECRTSWGTAPVLSCAWKVFLSWLLICCKAFSLSASRLVLLVRSSR